MMEIKIYQINLDRDDNGVAFESMDMLEKHYKTNEIKADLYDKVFDGTVNADDLEEVYGIFNIDIPTGFVGRSLSVSDVVEVVSSDKTSPGFYFCDSIGFQKIDFDPTQTQEKEPYIEVVLVEPGKFARTAKIDPSLAGLQQAVGGCIETYYPFEEEVCIVCNDEGKINGMTLNRGIYGEDGKLMDIIAGPFFICDCSTDRFGSLNAEQKERYTEQFRLPERFYKRGNEIEAVPYEPKETKKEER